MLTSGLVDVQSHTYWHPDFRKEKSRRTSANYAAFIDTQLGRSKIKLEQELGIEVDLLAWLYGIGHGCVAGFRLGGDTRQQLIYVG